MNDVTQEKYQPTDLEHEGEGFLTQIWLYVEDNAVAWSDAMVAVCEATGKDEEAVRAFLNTLHGGRFADTVGYFLQKNGNDLDDAIHLAIGAWKKPETLESSKEYTGVRPGQRPLASYIFFAHNFRIELEQNDS